VVCVMGIYSMLSYLTLRSKVMIIYDMGVYCVHDRMVVGFISNHNQCLSSLTLWGVLDTTLFDQVCRWLATGLEFSPDTLVSSTNKTDSHDITEILLKVALSTTEANIYDMARSHEGRDDKQHIVRGNTSLYQIS
jgi:hypothetical protein